MHAHEFKLQPSKQFFALFLVVIVVSLGIVWYLPISTIIKLFALTGFGIYSIKIYRMFVCLQDQRAIISFQRDHSRENSWLIKTGQGLHPAKLLEESTVTHVVSVLCFTTEAQRHTTCVMFRDSLPLDDYRLAVKVLSGTFNA